MRVTHPRRALLAAVVAVLCLLAIAWIVWPEHTGSGTRSPGGSSESSVDALPRSAPLGIAQDDHLPTTVYAHNLKLRKGPAFRIYISWIRGQMLRSNPHKNPSFDDPESFIFHIEKGVIHANLGDIGNFLNTVMPSNFALKNIQLTGDGEQLRLTGTMHKLLLALPVELLSTVSATQDGRVHLHVTKINVLKLPMKALLGGLHVRIADIMGKAPLTGVQVAENDIFFDTERLLPPPHIRGQLTAVSLERPDLVLIYGNSPNDPTRLAQWHNFLRFTNGTLDFGKLTMRHADLTLIDASSEPWFDFDLVNYQAQLVNGYSRITPEQGLEIFMPSLNGKAPKKNVQSVTLDWLKDRKTSLPADVPGK